MPYKSDAQRRLFHAKENRGEIDAKTVKEFDKASKGKKLPERVGRGQSKKVGCGHASCVGKGCSMKTGKGQGPPVRDSWATDAPQAHDEFEASRRATVPLPGSTLRTPNSGMGEHLPYEKPLGGGQARKPVGRGQAKPPKTPKAAPDKMPKRGKRGAQPLPVAKKAVSRRHRPPMNRKPPLPGMPGQAPMPAGPGIPGGPPGMGMPPMGGGAPMPGMPQPPIPGMGQARKRGY